jgi:hypothetical protein
MSELIIRETWPDSGESPNAICYILGPLEVNIPPYAPSKFPEEQLKLVRERAREYVEEDLSFILPKILKDNGSVDYDLFVDLNEQDGEKRLDAQYFRVNLDPTELYVLSETNNSTFRLKTDESGFSNMLITGTWIDNGFNVGCVEAGVMAGLQTARAVVGEPIQVVGETDRTL